MRQFTHIVGLFMAVLLLAACSITPLEGVETAVAAQQDAQSESPPFTVVPAGGDTVEDETVITPEPDNTSDDTETKGGIPASCTNDLDFVSDVTVADGTQIRIGQTFVKTWRVRNSGTCVWNGSYQFRQTSGNAIVWQSANRPIIPITYPGQTIDISASLVITMNNVDVQKTETAYFTLVDTHGQGVGDNVFVQVSVLPTNQKSGRMTFGNLHDPDCTNDLTFVQDITIPDGTGMYAGNTFNKTWRVRNTGTCTWDHSYNFKLISGQGFAYVNAPIIPTTYPGQTIDISAQLRLNNTSSSSEVGTFQLFDPYNRGFGQFPFVQVNVLTNTQCTNHFQVLGVSPAPTVNKGQAFNLQVSLLNSGTCAWQGYYLNRVGGDYLQLQQGAVAIPHTAAGQSVTVAIPVIVPTNTAINYGNAMMTVRVFTHSNQAFGLGIDLSATVQSTPPPCQLNSEFVLDVNVPDGTVIPAGQQFNKTWRLRNNGSCAWENVRLQRLDNTSSGFVQSAAQNNAVTLPTVPAGQTVDVSFPLVLSSNAPAGTTQRAYFRLVSNNGTFFGAIPYVDIVVEDNQPPPSCTLNSQFISDITIPDNTQIQAGQQFTKTWRLQNNGNCAWENVRLQRISDNSSPYIQTNVQGGADYVTLPSVPAGQSVDVAIPLMLSSNAPTGTTQRANFRLVDSNGTFFGAIPYVQIVVAGNPPPSCTFSSTFIDDVTIPDGTMVTVGSEFTKTWRVQNSGTCDWNNLKLTLIEDTSSDQIVWATANDQQFVLVPNTVAGGTVDIDVPLRLNITAPFGSTQRAYFRIEDTHGQVFGAILTVEVIAGADGGEQQDAVEN